MFSLFNKKRLEDSHVVADLDQIIAQPVGFRFGGKTHQIVPISTKEFYALANATAQLWALKDAKEITPDQLIDRYYSLVASVCKTIKRRDIEGMTQAQVTALYALIMDAVTGKAHVRTPLGEEDEKKKTVAQ